MKILKSDFGLNFVLQSLLIFIDLYSFSAKFQMIDTSMNNFEAKTEANQIKRLKQENWQINQTAVLKGKLTSVKKLVLTIMSSSP